MSVKLGRFAVLFLLVCALISSTCGGSGSPSTPSAPSPTNTVTSRSNFTVTIGTIAGEKTASGYTYRFPVTVREIAGVAGTVTAVAMQFFTGTSVVGNVNRTENIPYGTIGANGSGAVNWTIADDNAPSYATRLQVTVTYTDTVGAQTATAAADVPALPMTPITYTISGTTREGNSGLSDVQVSIVGTSLSTVSDGQGRYTLSSVPAGSATIRAARSGWDVVQQTITVSGNLTVDFGLIRAGAGAQAPSIGSFTADSSSITRGQSTTLRWSVANATTISIDNGVGSVAANGSRSVSPTTPTTYRLTATNTAGSANASVTLNVNSSNPNAMTCNFPTGAGVTAVCANGQTSMSQNPSGTCSQNGGVACWVCPGVLCHE
jgi:hypothetical protein